MPKKKKSKKRNSENVLAVIEPNATYCTGVLNQYEEETIYFDPLFLQLINTYNKTMEFINHFQFITKTASFNILSGVVSLVLLFYFSFNILESYVEVNNLLPIFDNKSNMLQEILKYEINKSFLNDMRLFSASNEKYMNDHYALLIKFIDSEMIHFRIQDDKIESLINHCSNLSIFIAALPLVFNLPRWTKFVALITALTTKFLTDRSIGSSLGMMVLVNVGLGAVLLTVHYVNLSFFIVAVLNEKNY